MASIYEISEDYLTVQEMLYDNETDEQVVLDTLESIAAEFEDKADTYARMINNLLSDVNAIKLEEKRLSARRTALEGRAQSLKDMLEYNMRAVGKTKFKTELFSFGIQKNGGLQTLALDVDSINDIPEEFLIPRDPIADTDAIRTLLKTEQVPWAHLEPRGESLRIR